MHLGLDGPVRVRRLGVDGSSDVLDVYGSGALMGESGELGGTARLRGMFIVLLFSLLLQHLCHVVLEDHGDGLIGVLFGHFFMWGSSEG